MRDNKTSQPAQLYESNVEKTLPFYRTFHEQTLDLIRVARPDPESWLDTGCGTGLLVESAAAIFSNTSFVLADPSDAMLAIARGRFDNDDSIKTTFVLSGTEDLDLPDERFDIITAIMSHHYFDFETRKKATDNCMRMLKKGGIYVNIESIRPNTERGCQIGLARWRDAQIRQGKSKEEAVRHLDRYGIELLPIKTGEHLDIMKDAGFSTVEIFWSSIMQAGFYAIK